MPSPVETSSAATPEVFRSKVWASVPLLTLGFGTAMPFVYAAIRFRSRTFALFAAMYGTLAFLCLWLLNATPATDTWQSAVGAAVALASVCGGTGHIWALHQETVEGPGQRTSTSDNPAIRRAQDRLRLREEARRIASRQPDVARELRIGRPDLPRYFDDGGLVDINHVPPEIIEKLPDIGRDAAQHIVVTRSVVGRFDSLEDLALTTGLAPQTFDEAQHLLIFR